mmetsp:Transcript_9040/g.22067  ORF Transcript_9040/g.22067 Transcript_9040/m.22067 type:complete len:356 (+) Transcript_9040:1635-2702(+)
MVLAVLRRTSAYGHHRRARFHPHARQDGHAALLQGEDQERAGDVPRVGIRHGRQPRGVRRLHLPVFDGGGAGGYHMDVAQGNAVERRSGAQRRRYDAEPREEGEGDAQEEEAQVRPRVLRGAVRRRGSAGPPRQSPGRRRRIGDGRCRGRELLRPGGRAVRFLRRRVPDQGARGVAPRRRVRGTPRKCERRRPEPMPGVRLRTGGGGAQGESRARFGHPRRFGLGGVRVEEGCGECAEVVGHQSGSEPGEAVGSRAGHRVLRRRGGQLCVLAQERAVHQREHRRRRDGARRGHRSSRAESPLDEAQAWRARGRRVPRRRDIRSRAPELQAGRVLLAHDGKYQGSGQARPVPACKL